MTEINFTDSLYFASVRFTKILTKRCTQQFKRVALSPACAFILMSLNGDDTTTPTQLADILSVDQSTITRSLNQLEQRTLIKRENAGRHVVVSLTIDGRQLQPTLARLWTDLNRSYQTMFTVNDESQLCALLKSSLTRALKE